jgi:hypothetical protein
VVEEVCQSAQDIIDSYLWYNQALVYSTYIQSSVATITTTQPHGFVVGQTVTVTKCGATINSTATITGATMFTFTYACAQPNEKTHLVRPFGLVRGPNHSTAYASVPAVRESAMMIAVDIWQARQAPSGQGASIDGFVPSPFKMGNTLIARIRGLLAPYMAPTAMLG